MSAEQDFIDHLEKTGSYDRERDFASVGGISFKGKGARTGATATITHWPKGKEPKPGEYFPGDILLVRDKSLDVIGELINAGSQVRHGKSWFTHSALIVNNQAGQASIIEAEESGVMRNRLAKYRDNDYVIVSPIASTQQRELAIGFASAEIGAKYDKLDWFSLAAQCLFRINASFHSDTRFICSGLVARATEKYIVAYPRSSESMMPDDIAMYYGVIPPFPEPDKSGFVLNVLLGLKAALSVVFGKGDPPQPIKS